MCSNLENVGAQAAYMQLPTDQYVLIPLPNNAKLEKKSNGLFTLLVPELQIFNVWMRPHVVSSVDVTPSGVLIEVREKVCTLISKKSLQEQRPSCTNSSIIAPLGFRLSSVVLMAVRRWKDST